MKLTSAQRELLSILSVGPRYDITDKRVANALGLKKLIKYDVSTDTWYITDKGIDVHRAALSPKSPDHAR